MAVIPGTENPETLTGGIDNDTITGLGGNDTLVGNGGDDVIEGGIGNDVIDGGEGNDTASYENSPNSVGVFVNLSTGFTNGDAGNDTLISIENVIGSTISDTLIGNGFNNVLTGLGGDDLLVGEAGDDTLIGGAGGDFLRGRSGNDSLQGGLDDDFLSGGEGNDTMDGGDGFDRVSMFLIPTDPQTGATADLAIVGQQDTGHGLDTFISIEHVSGTAFADTLSGNFGDNWLWGLGGNDVLDGRDGNDLLEIGAGQTTVSGGVGTDSLSFFNNQDFVGGVVASLLLQGAAQTVNGTSTVNASGIENISGSNFDDTLTGDRGNNVLGGITGNDTLNGGDGDDVLLGDGGFSMLSFNNQGGSGPIGQFDDDPDSPGNDILNGGSGNDRMIGGAGDDALDGGKGIDVAGYSTATAAVSVNLALTVAQDTFGAGVDTLIGIESLDGSLFGDSLTGNTLVNVLSGLAGDDILDGGKGNDVLNGGEGIDTATYASSAAAVTVSLLTGLSSGGAGKDSLSGIENLTGSAFRDVLIGDGGSNVLYGGDGNDSLEGGAGDDRMSGEAGTDLVTYASASSGVTVSLALATAQNTVGAGIDTLSGFEDLTGSKFADSLTGDALANRITGGLGADILSGGEGKDRFVYLAAQDSSLKNTDLITDLTRADVLDLSAIDANAAVAGDQAFTLAAALTGVAGQYTLTFNAASGQTQLLADINGDSKADFALLFTGDVTGLTGSWVL